METHIARNEYGEVLRWCWWCQDYEPVYDWISEWYCKICGHKLDYDLVLAQLPGVKCEQ